MSGFDLSGYLLVGPHSSNQTGENTKSSLSNQDIVNNLLQDKQNLLLVEENKKYLEAEAKRRGILESDPPSFDYTPFIILLLVSLVVCIFIIALGNVFPFIPASAITILCVIVISIGIVISFREYSYYTANYIDAATRMDKGYLDKTSMNDCVGPLCCSDSSGTVWDPERSTCVVKPSTVLSSNAMPISRAYNSRQLSSGSIDVNGIVSVFNKQTSSGSNYIPGNNTIVSNDPNNKAASLFSSVLSYLNEDASVGRGSTPSIPGSSPTAISIPGSTATPSLAPANTPGSSSDPSTISTTGSSANTADTGVYFNNVRYTGNGSFLFNGALITDSKITSRFYLNNDDGFSYSCIDYNNVNNTVSVVVPDPNHSGYTIRRDNLYCSFTNCGTKVTNNLYRTFNKENPYNNLAVSPLSSAIGSGSGPSFAPSNPITTYSGSGSLYGSRSGSSTLSANTPVTGSLYASASGPSFSPSNSGVTYSRSDDDYDAEADPDPEAEAVSVPSCSSSIVNQFDATVSTNIQATRTSFEWTGSILSTSFLSYSLRNPVTLNVLPTLNSTYLNGKPAIVFGTTPNTYQTTLSTDNFIQNPNTTLNYTCFFVVNIDTLPATGKLYNLLSYGGTFVSNGNNSLHVNISSDGSLSCGMNTNSSSSFNTVDKIKVVPNCPFILMLNYYQNKENNYSQIVLRVNGNSKSRISGSPGSGSSPTSQKAVQFINGATTLNTNMIDIGGWRNDSVGDPRTICGGISEFLFYNTNIDPFTDSYISQVENYLSTKWDIPIQQVTSSGSGSIPRIIPDPTVLFKPPKPTFTVAPLHKIGNNPYSYTVTNIVINVTTSYTSFPITGFKVYYATDSIILSADLTNPNIFNRLLDQSVLTLVDLNTTKSSSITIPGLKFGTKYFIYMVAYNTVAMSEGTIMNTTTFEKLNPSLASYGQNDNNVKNNILNWWRDGNDIVIDVSRGKDITHCKVWVVGGGNGGGFSNAYPGILRNRNGSDLIPVINNGQQVRVSPGGLKSNGDTYRITIQGYNDITGTFTTENNCDYGWFMAGKGCIRGGPGEIRSGPSKWG